MPYSLDANRTNVLTPDELARWYELRAQYQVYLASKTSSPEVSVFFDLGKVYPDVNELPVLIEQVEDLQKCLDSFMPLNPTQIKRSEDEWDIEYIYESSRIEGSTLTLEETAQVINDGVTLDGRRLNEHLEALNHKKAIDYIRDLAAGSVELNEFILNCIHALILRGIDEENAGKYRSIQVKVPEATYIPPQADLVPQLVQDLFVFYEAQKNAVHPLYLAAEMHERFLAIRPYVDGNGRTARLLMNLILLQRGYTIANIPADQKSDYYHALEKDQTEHDMSDFYHLLAKAEKISLIKYLSIVSVDIAKEAEGKGWYFFERIRPYL